MMIGGFGIVGGAMRRKRHGSATKLSIAQLLLVMVTFCGRHLASGRLIWRIAHQVNPAKPRPSEYLVRSIEGPARR